MNFLKHIKDFLIKTFNNIFAILAIYAVVYCSLQITFTCIYNNYKKQINHCNKIQEKINHIEAQITQHHKEYIMTKHKNYRIQRNKKSIDPL